MAGRQFTHYELLEIAPRATREEIQVAYNRARTAFAQNSLAVYSLFSADECQDLQQRIEEAYRTLMNEEARRRYDETIGLGGPDAPRPAVIRPAPPGPPPRLAPVPLRAVPGAAAQGPAEPPEPRRLPASEPGSGVPAAAGAASPVPDEPRAGAREGAAEKAGDAAGEATPATPTAGDPSPGQEPP